MTASTLNQIATSAQALADLVVDFDPLRCTENELGELIRLGEKLEEVGVTLHSKAASKYAWEASSGLRFKISAVTSKVISREEVLSPVRFQRSIKVIFEGPEVSPESRASWQRRAKNYEARCQRIRKSSPDAIVTWALTFAPNSWIANNMNNQTFSCLLTFVESRPSKMWPPQVYELLETLKQDETLHQSSEYSHFMHSLKTNRLSTTGADQTCLLQRW
ncbi:hypothetical protein FDECE_11705 [Fusarium decemcellulare]|nr:hypothetical protein FDECE_11705 [Fusarium decemcellulare]